MTDPVLEQAIISGDLDAFARWVARAEPRIRRSLSSFAGRVDTEALVQDALLAVWQVAPRFQPDGRPEGLLRLGIRIAQHRAISELRRARVAPTEIEALERAAAALAEDPQPPDPLLRRLIQGCRDKLPERPARALAQRLAAHGGRSDAELAQELGMRLNTFLQNIRRARLALADCLQSQGVSLDGLAPGAP